MLELAGIIVLGIFAQWIAWRLKLPAILPLILIGLIVGPISTLWTDGSKWIEPTWNGERGLFPGEYLFNFVELAIGIILFEGGLTLKREEVLGVGASIVKLISVGSLVTFVGGAILGHFILELNWAISFLIAGLIIVTGPTVIAPILRNIPLKRNVATILKWEGILIDPIGALVAVLVFEFIYTFQGEGGHFTQHALIQFLQVVFVSLSLGFLAAFTLKELLKRQWIPHYLMNVFTLAFVLFIFVSSGYIVHDAGLLTVVVMGMVMGNMNVPNLKEILYFKESLSVLLIAVLFILLSANMQIEDLTILLNWRCAVFFLAVILLLRPIGVLLSTRNSLLTLNEKMFISWVGPRGIVAAGIASLFGLKLMNPVQANGTSYTVEGAEFITPIVFMIVLGTVLLNATTARMLAKWLGVLLQKSHGVLIIGAHKAARLIAQYLHDNDRHVALIDSNRNHIQATSKSGLQGFQVDIYSEDLTENLELNDIGFLMALTGSPEVNAYACAKLGDQFGENGAYRLVSAEEMKNLDMTPENGLFSRHDDYINFIEVARDYPVIHEAVLRSSEHFGSVLLVLNRQPESIPLFLKRKDGFLEIITTQTGPEMAEEGDTLVYLGKEIGQEAQSAQST